MQQSISIHIIWVLCFCHLVFAKGQLKEISKGKFAITGRGCGTLTQIRYLDKIPSNLDDFHCAIIDLNTIESNSEQLEDNFKNYCFRENVDLYSNDLIHITEGEPLESADKCYDKCKSTTTCLGFTWVSGACMLKFKASPEDLQPLEGHISAMMTDCKVKRCVRENLNIIQANIGQFITNSPQVCFETCKITDNCKGFTWVISSQNCYLKDDVSNTATSTAGLVSIILDDCQ